MKVQKAISAKYLQNEANYWKELLLAEDHKSSGIRTINRRHQNVGTTQSSLKFFEDTINDKEELIEMSELESNVYIPTG